MMRLTQDTHHQLPVDEDNWKRKTTTSANFTEDFYKNYGALLQKMRITKETPQN